MFNNINMNFFNVQFLILIGMVVVIYFLYKEINFLYKKINKLEEKINKSNTELKIEIKPDQELEIKNLDNNALLSSSDSSDHIAIYSNDNEQSHSNTLHIDSEKNIITNQQIDESINIEAINKYQEEFNNNEPTESIDFNQELVESHIGITIQSALLPIINEIKQYNNNLKLEEIQINNNLKIDDIQINNNLKLDDINIDNLQIMKLTELKQLAETYNITLSKKINGIQKQKNKKELIDNILNLKKNI